MAATVIVSTQAELLTALATRSSDTIIQLESGDYGSVVFNAQDASSPIRLQSADTSHPATFTSLSLQNVNGVEIDGLQFGPSGALASGSSLLTIANSENVYVHNSFFDAGAASTGLSVTNSSIVTVDHNSFEDLTKAAVFNGISDLTVTNNELTNDQTHAFDFIQSAGAAVAGNEFSLASSAGATSLLAAAQIASTSATYPSAVVSGGLESVWDLQYTAGLENALTFSAGSSALPAGVTRSGSTITISQSVNLTNWDFTGYTVVVDGNINVAFTNCRFAHSGAPNVLDIGANSGAPNVTVNHCEFNLTGVTEVFQSPIRFYGGNFTLQNSYLHDAPTDYVTQLSMGTFTATDNYITSPGMMSSAGDHIEMFHLRAGTSILNQNFFDARNGIGVVAQNTMTGLVYVEGLNGNVNTTATENIFLGAAGLGSYYALQLSGGGAYSASLTLNDNVIQGGINGGPSGFVAVNGSGTYRGTGNIDFDSGSTGTSSSGSGSAGGASSGSADVNHLPVTLASDKTVAPNANLAASSLFSVTDADGDAVVRYQLVDATAGGSSGHFVINGVAQAANQTIELTAAQLGQTTFQAGTTGDQLSVRAFDGTGWGAWDSFQITVNSSSSSGGTSSGGTGGTSSGSAGGTNNPNHLPVTSASDKVVAHNANLTASSLFSVTDADGDSITRYQFWDATADSSSGHFVVNGAAQSANQTIDVTAAQLGQTTFRTGSTGDQLYVRAYDGTGWSAWDSFQITIRSNHGPVATAPDRTVAHNADLAASSLFVVTDSDGDSVTRYQFWDSTADASSGYFVINGVAQAANQAIDVTAAQLAQTTFHSGSGSDQLSVRAFDGTDWGAWDNFTIAAPANIAPVVNAPDRAVSHAANVSAASLFTTADSNGDAIARYQFWDSTPDASSGHFVVNGVAQGSGQAIDVTAAQLAQTTFQSGSGSDQLWVRSFDGTAWSAWDSFTVTAPVDRAPIAVAPDRAVAHGANVAAASLFSVTDSDQDAMTRYQFWDSTADASSGHFVVNGVAQGTGQAIEVTAAQLAQTSFQSGSDSDLLWVRSFDGTTWSAWDSFTVSAPVNHAPTVTAADRTVARGSNLAASSLFSASDADGDTISRYQFWDSTADASSGHFLVSGVAQGVNQAIDVTAAQLAQTTFQSGSGSDQLWVRAFDGMTWSAWDAFTVAAPVNGGPIVTVADPVSSAIDGVAFHFDKWMV